jgi:hypothetical protein
MLGDLPVYRQLRLRQAVKAGENLAPRIADHEVYQSDTRHEGTARSSCSR